MGSGPPASAARVTVAATSCMTLGMLPIFLLGGLAALVQQDLRSFDEAHLGAAVSIYFLGSAVSMVAGGHFADWRGPRTGMIIASLGSAGALVALSATASRNALFGACLLAGVANGIGQPASNLGLARGVLQAKQGLAFGIKQAANPFAGLLAGLAVPLVGLVVGWRWTFALATTLVVVVLALIPREFADRSAQQRADGRSDAPQGAVYLLAASAACGTAAANALSAFLVVSIVAYGIGYGTAGYILALGSASGVVGRLFVGWAADRRGHKHLPVVAGMLAIGAVGFALLAAGTIHPALIVAGTVIGFGFGWGWPGLMLYAIVRLTPAGPALSTGIVSAGAAVGGVVGPLAFGLVARGVSFTAAWSLSAGLALVGSGLAVACRSSVRRAVEDGRMLPPPGSPGPH